MNSTAKKMIIGSMAASGIVALAAILDIITKFPFTRLIMMDVMFLIGAGIVLYMGYDAYKDLS